MASWNCYVLFNLFSLLLGQANTEQNLKLVIVVFRHGDRSPLHTYPLDTYKENSWPDGFGQLTKIGKEQHYELGQYLRKRYAEFLSLSYKSHEVYVRSTDIDRTIMSAQANLAGLFPPHDDQIWNRNISWQPVPVHTVPVHEENLLFIPEHNCPRYAQLLKDSYTSKKYLDLIDPYSDFLKMISQNTGYSFEELAHGKVWTTYDSLFCEDIHNFTLPTWATKETMGKLHHLTEIVTYLRYGIYKHQEKSRLQGGVLLNSILKNITAIKTSPSNQRKIIMYSAHDTTIAALQMALNVSNRKMPPYAACHFFELYHEDGQYNIKMFYRNDSSVEPHPLILPGCTLSCPLEKFIELTSPVIAPDWKKECGKVQKYSATILGLSITVALLIIVVLGVLFIYLYNLYLQRSNYESV
ncbi:prostatic acid phosphatase [Rhinophrynus dorsalis]